MLAFPRLAPLASLLARSPSALLMAALLDNFFFVAPVFVLLAQSCLIAICPGRLPFRPPVRTLLACPLSPLSSRLAERPLPRLADDRRPVYRPSPNHAHRPFRLTAR